MRNTPKCLAIIPARGGSTRLKKKNIKLLNHKPLIHYTIEAAIQSRCFDRILFSSDDDDILDCASCFSELVLEKRPDHLATNQSKVIELVCEIADRKALQDEYDIIALLLPTCPFRRAEDLQNGLSLLTKEVDSVVSVTNYDFSPTLSVTLEGEEQIVKGLFDPCPLITGNTRSQDHAPAYRPNGAFYMSWWKPFLINRNFWKGKVRGYPMPRLFSVDIDEEQDLRYAEFLLQHNFVSIT
jgi:CMP-N,N'-diacetyllegionaminic acid synthase